MNLIQIPLHFNADMEAQQFKWLYDIQRFNIVVEWLAREFGSQSTCTQSGYSIAFGETKIVDRTGSHECCLVGFIAVNYGAGDPWIRHVVPSLQILYVLWFESKIRSSSNQSTVRTGKMATTQRRDRLHGRGNAHVCRSTGMYIYYIQLNNAMNRL